MQYRTNRARHLAAAISGIIAFSSNAYADSDSQTLQNEVQALRKEVAELRAGGSDRAGIS